ncbi:MAG: hypothetical protein WD032_03260 [Nitrospirales bacterium]
MTLLSSLRNVASAKSHSCRSQAWEKARVGILAMLLVLSLASDLLAESPVTKEPLIEHLEFLGYECDVIDAGIRAKHLSKIHLYITNAFGGIRLQTGFPGKSPSSDEASRYVETNALMRQFAVVQLYWSDDGNLFAMAWLPGRYEKTRFALFMEAWDRDTSLLRQNHEKLKMFLKEPQ